MWLIRISYFYRYQFFFSKFVNKKIINVICTYIFLKYIAYFIFQKMQNSVRIFIEFYPRKLIFKGIFNVRNILKKWKKTPSMLKNIDVFQTSPNTSVGFCGNIVDISSTCDEAYTSYSMITAELPFTSLSNLEHRSVIRFLTAENVPAVEIRRRLANACMLIA